LKVYRETFGIDLEDKYSNEFAQAEGDGLVEIRNGELRLTRRGMLYSNQVFSIFV
jgi:coproporphyrinogen III oxidase-like Fe-S oxidoreductase